MANLGHLSVDLDANVAKFITNLDNGAKALERFDKRSAALVSSIKGTLVGLGAGAIFTKMIQESAQAETAAKNVASVLKTTGGAAGVTAKQVDDLANSYSKLTGVDDDVIKGAEAIALRFKNIHSKEFPATVKAALDLSAATGGELNDSMLKIAKAMNDPKNKLGALEKAGVSFSESQKKMIGTLQDSGQMFRAQEMVLKQLEGTIGGLSETTRNSLEGAFKALDTTVGNLFATIGDAGPFGAFRYGVELTNTALEHFTTVVYTDVLPGISQIGTEIAAAFGSQTAKAVTTWAGTQLEKIIKFSFVATNSMIHLGKAISLAFQGKFNADTMNALWQGFLDDAKLAYDTKFVQGITDGWNDIDKETKAKLLAWKNAAKRVRQGLDEGAAGDEKHAKEIEQLEKIGLHLYNQAQQEKAITAGRKEDLLLLQATEKIAGIHFKNAKERADALAVIIEFERQISEEKQKQEDNKKAEENRKQKEKEHQNDLDQLKDITAEIQDQTKHKDALIKLSGTAIARIEAEDKVRKLTNLTIEERKKAEDDLTIAIENQHKVDNVQEWDKKIEALNNETEALKAKVEGKEKEFEIQKKINELLKEKFLTPQQVTDYTAEITKQYEEQERLNKAYKDQKDLLSKIESGTGSYKAKQSELNQAVKDGKITADQYNDSLKKLNDQALKNVNKSVKDFTSNLSDGLIDALAHGEKLSDVFKKIGIQLAKAGIQKFLVAPLSNAAGNYAQKIIQQQMQGTGGGGLLASILKKMYPTAPSVAPGLVKQPTGSGATPQVSNANPALSSGGQFSGPIGTTSGAAATQAFDSIARIATTLDLVKTPTLDGEAILVKIARTDPPKMSGPMRLKSGTIKNDEPGSLGENVIPFLRRFEGHSRGGPAFRVIEPDCPCPTGVTGKGATSPAASSASARGDGFQFHPDVMGQFLGSMWGSLFGNVLDSKGGGSGGGNNRYKWGDITTNNISGGGLPNLPGAKSIEDLLNSVIDQGKHAVRVTNPECPCPPDTAGGAASGLKNKGYQPLTPKADTADGGAPALGMLKGILDAAANLGGGSSVGPGGGGYGGMMPGVYGGFDGHGGGPPLAGYAGQNGELRGAYNDGTIQAYGSVSGQMLTPTNGSIRGGVGPGGNIRGGGMYAGTNGGGQMMKPGGSGMPTSGIQGPWSYQQTGINGSFMPTSGDIGGAPQYNEFMRRASAMNSAGNYNFNGGVLPTQGNFQPNSAPGFQPTPFILQGSPYAGQGGYVDDEPQFKPGFTGGVNHSPMYAPWGAGTAGMAAVMQGDGFGGFGSTGINTGFKGGTGVTEYGGGFPSTPYGPQPHPYTAGPYGNGTLKPLGDFNLGYGVDLSPEQAARRDAMLAAEKGGLVGSTPAAGGAYQPNTGPYQGGGSVGQYPHVPGWGVKPPGLDFSAPSGYQPVTGNPLDPQAPVGFVYGPGGHLYNKQTGAYAAPSSAGNKGTAGFGSPSIPPSGGQGTNFYTSFLDPPPAPLEFDGAGPTVTYGSQPTGAMARLQSDLDEQRQEQQLTNAQAVQMVEMLNGMKPGTIPLRGFASGGNYRGNEPFWTGEKGRELNFPGGRSGSIVSNDKIAQAVKGSSTPQIQIVNNGHPIDVQTQDFDPNTNKLRLVVNSVAKNSAKKPPALRRG